TITASSGGVTGSASLTVSAATLVSIAVIPANSSMAVGTTKQFTATGTYSDTSAQDITSSVLWSSSSAATATINNQGAATSVATGTTTITAALGSVSGSTQLTVSIAHLTLITISPANPRIAKGTSLKFTATGTFSDGSTATSSFIVLTSQDIILCTHWSSCTVTFTSIANAPNIGGWATATRSETATIGGNYGGITNSATLTVQ